jgi:hypothetical protein
VSIKIRSKHSSVANKAPLPADLVEGEIALNINSASPAAYIKDSAGAIVKLAGVGSVSTPDATDAVKGVVELATATETVDGVDATRAVTPAGLKSALGAQAGSSTAPAAPVTGQVWVDSSTSPSTIKVWNGTAWIPQAGATVTSATAPTTPATGQIWIDNSVSPSVTKIWDGTAWVTATPDGAAAAAIANDAKYATKAELQAEDLWDRSGTEVTPKNAGDSVFTSGAVKVGGTTAASNLQLKADGGIVANTDGLVYDAAQKRLALGTSTPDIFGRSDAQILGINATNSGDNMSLQLNAGATATRGAQIYMGQGGTRTFTLASNANETTLGTVTSTPLKFSTGDTVRATLDTSGRLGIGTTSPGTVTEIFKDTYPDFQLKDTAGRIHRLAINSQSGDPKAAFISDSPWVFQTSAGTERIKIDTSGRLLAGTSSTTSSINKLVLAGGADGGPTGGILLASTAGTPVDGGGLGVLHFTADNHSPAAVVQARRDGGTWTPGSSQPTRLEFSTTADGASSPTERMSIRNDGQVWINKTSTTNNARLEVAASASGGTCIATVQIDANTRTHLAVFNTNGLVGQISSNGSATSYATSSDYRLKENVAPLSGAAARVKQLKPSQFNFKADPGKTVDGFIAHEAQAVVPECVTGTKDEVDADGNPVYQGIDQSKLVPLLTAALQEALAKIETLEARLTKAGI